VNVIDADDDLPILSNLPDLATPAEVAQVLRCSARYVNGLCARAQLESNFVAGRYLITRESVKMFLGATKICLKETPEPRLSGGRSAMYGKLSGTSVEDVAADRRVQETVSRLLKSSRGSCSIVKRSAAPLHKSAESSTP
jgi:hypothetical protein